MIMKKFNLIGRIFGLTFFAVFAISAAFGDFVHAKTISKSKKAIASKLVKKPDAINAANFLNQGVWRGENCEPESNFQKFSLNSNSPSFVEVGYGIVGEGEKLEIVKFASQNDILEIQTKVCAPIGCNQTFEQYKIINSNRLFELTFEGHLPDQPPNIVVQNGRDKQGNLGRFFTRCNK
jgi:hypothetical protein